MYRSLTVVVLLGIASTSTLAQEPTLPYPRPNEFATHDDIRAGGVLATSYAYHQTPYAPLPSPQPCIMPANGAYGYGFPVTTYRWGWFGAERYYPRVFWFSGYYNDCVRCAYRQGY